MRITHIIPGLTVERGGPSQVVVALASHQIQAGHQVAVLTTEQGIGLGEEPIGMPPEIELRRTAMIGPARFAYSPRFESELNRLLRRTDILHIHSIFTNPVHKALRAAGRSGVPVVLRPCGQLHRYSLRKNSFLKKSYLRLFGRMIRQACTAWHYTSEKEAIGSWPQDNSPRFILANGIEPADFQIDEMEAALRLRKLAPKLPVSAPYVLFLGRIHNKKRIDLLIESFIVGAPPECYLIVAGPDEQRLWEDACRKAMARGLKIENRVQRVGVVSGPDKAALLRGATLFALPSEHENFGIAALESLMAGTPTLLSPHVDLHDAIAREQLGYSAPLSVERWAQSFASLLADRARLTEMGARAALWAKKNYSWDKISSEMTLRYQEAIGRRISASPGTAGHGGSDRS